MFLAGNFFLKIKNVHFTTIYRSTNILLAIILDSCLLDCTYYDFVNTTIIYCKATNKDLFINRTTVVKNKLYAKPTFLKMKNRVKCNRSISPIVFVSWYTWKPVVDCASHVGSCPCPPTPTTLLNLQAFPSPSTLSNISSTIDLQ